MTPPQGTLTEQMVTDWANSRGVTEQVAARIARQILTGRLVPYAELPSNDSLADEHGVSESTVVRAKRLLAQHGILRKELGAYWVA